MKLLKKLFGNKNNHEDNRYAAEKDSFLSIFGTLDNATLAQICPQAAFEIGTIQLSTLPRILKCGGCGAALSIPDKAFLIKRDFIGGRYDFVEKANFGFGVNAVGSYKIEAMDETTRSRVLPMTLSSVTSILKDLRNEKEPAVTWGCMECHHAENRFPAAWAKSDPQFDEIKDRVLKTESFEEFVNANHEAGFELIGQSDTSIVTRALRRNDFTILVMKAPNIDKRRIHTLTVGVKGSYSIELVKDLQDRF
jgi:hypothetical protein